MNHESIDIVPKQEAARKPKAPKARKQRAVKVPKRSARSNSRSASGRRNRKARSHEQPTHSGATKTATVIELLSRPEGATIAQIAQVTEWQKHSIRGFISGTIGKKMALTVESTKNGAGERVYRINR